jgi:hypothetical protein
MLITSINIWLYSTHLPLPLFTIYYHLSVITAIFAPATPFLPMFTAAREKTPMFAPTSEKIEGRKNTEFSTLFDHNTTKTILYIVLLM